MSEDVSQPLVQASLLGEAIDRGPALVFVTDEEMRYVAVNQHAADMLGYTRAELLALRLTDVAPGEDTAERYAAFLARPDERGEIALRGRGGGELTFRYAAKQTTVAGLTLYVTVGFVDG